jgi:hypothetical protein
MSRTRTIQRRAKREGTVGYRAAVSANRVFNVAHMFVALLIRASWRLHGQAPDLRR